jgi:hypothetical protein
MPVAVVGWTFYRVRARDDHATAATPAGKPPPLYSSASFVVAAIGPDAA